MQYYLLRARIEYKQGEQATLFGIFKFDEIRGNLILGFVEVTSNSDWSMLLSSRRTLTQNQESQKE
jgi:hypothetical protein